VLFTFSARRLVGRGRRGVAAAHSSPPPRPFERWTLLVLRFRWPILACWLAVLAGGVYASLLLPSHLATSFAVPGTDSARAERAIARDFGERPEGTFTVVFHVRHSSDRQLQGRLRRRLERGARALPGGRLGTFRVGGGVVYGELETKLDLQQAKGYTEPLRRALQSRDGPTALVSGQPAIQHDFDPQLASDLRRGEALALPLVLLVLAIVLGLSLALAVPFLFAACTVAGTLSVLYGATYIVTITPYATNLVKLVGLGLAVDYSLLIVCRYREELEQKRGREEALVRTMASAGRAVVFSGLAVAIGLALLLFVPVPFIRTMGLAGLLIPLVSIAAALTLQPALLSFCGRRALTGWRLSRLLPKRLHRHRAPWAALARAIMRHPLAVLVPTTALLLAAAAPIVFLQLGPGSLSSLPRSMPATQGLVVLRHGFGPGALTPTEVVVDAGSAGVARRPAVHAAVARLTDRLFHDPEVYVVAMGPDEPYVSHSSRYARVLVVGRHEFGEPPSQRLVDRLRRHLVPASDFPATTHVYAGGAAPQGVDFLARSYAYFPRLVLAALALTYLVLVLAFRSLLLPLKAVLLNLLSVAAACGLLVAVFRYGVGADLLGLKRSPQIEGWIPIFLFATLFGLSMDYEVFLVSRMREAWDNGSDNVEAVALGLERTGGLITAAALVMAVSFAGFVVGSVPGLQQFGLGLVFAVLIDVTLVRALLVPALMAIMGRWNWWLPTRLTRIAPTRMEAVHDA
jgi:putative drug exporter of the RND superfamily